MGAIPWQVGFTPGAAGTSWGLQPAARPSSTGHGGFPSTGILRPTSSGQGDGVWGKGYFRNCKCRHKLSCLQCKQQA